MAEITASSVKALRELTDLPMMECKRALVEAGGDQEKAIAILRENFAKVQLKRADNATEEGRIFTLVSDDGKRAAMVEIQCESPPVATGEILGKFGEACVRQVLESGADSWETLKSQTAPGAKQTLGEVYEEMSNKIREKIVVNRVLRVDGPVGAYVHHDGKTGVLFQATGEKATHDVLRDVAMHVAAMQPKVVNADELDQTAVQAERDRLTAEAKASGKPDNIVEKIVDGRMNVYYNDQGVLVSQQFAKEESKTVSQALAEAGLTAKAFHRWRVGAGG
jgi:elongation factor Ts